jgi:outer membrane protein assembly factor BamB
VTLSVAVALAVGLSAQAGTTQPGNLGKLRPAPRELYTIAWKRAFVEPTSMEWRPSETGGVAVDAGTGVAVFGTRDGWLHAVRKDRSLAWEYKANAGFAGPPAIVGGTVYVGARDGRLYALALETGKLVWSYDSNEELGTRPVVANGVVYVASLQDTVFAVDAATGAWKWHHHREGRSGFSIRGAADVVVGPGAVYGGYSDGAVVALDPATGRPLWERIVAPPGEQVDVDGLALADGRLYAAAYSGVVVALDPKTGVTLWTTRLAGAHTLTVSKGLVFVVSPDAVTALTATDGGKLWESRMDAASAGAPVVIGKWLVVPAALEGLRWIEIASGRTYRVLDAGDGVSGPPAAVGGRVYVLSNGGSLVALDLG